MSGRLSVRFPVQQPHEGSDRTRELLKFMCLGSDVGGINRRPLKVIFSLETAQVSVSQSETLIECQPIRGPGRVTANQRP